MDATSARLMSTRDGSWVSPISRSMRAIEDIVAEIACTNIPVLLIGESGTGKEVLARRIHGLSKQRQNPLAKITCASITTDKFSAQLAEHLQSVNGDDMGCSVGSLLLDELGDLDSACQAHLLHALPDGESVPAAGRVVSRVMALTTRDLEGEVRAGRFRSELYYRVSGVCLRLPPLRDRSEDIPSLVDFLLAKHAFQLARPRPVVRQESLKILVDYSWPGNIRELENVARRIVALGDEQRAIAELQCAPVASRKAETAALPTYSLKAAARAASKLAERELIMAALARTHWNRKRAAQELQISYKSLLYKLKQIGLEEGGAS
jgi:two-component system, NtrC family, response regulator AtoC